MSLQRTALCRTSVIGHMRRSAPKNKAERRRRPHLSPDHSLSPILLRIQHAAWEFSIRGGGARRRSRGSRSRCAERREQSVRPHGEYHDRRYAYRDADCRQHASIRTGSTPSAVLARWSARSRSSTRRPSTRESSGASTYALGSADAIHQRARRRGCPSSRRTGASRTCATSRGAPRSAKSLTCACDSCRTAHSRRTAARRPGSATA